MIKCRAKDAGLPLSSGEHKSEQDSHNGQPDDYILGFQTGLGRKDYPQTAGDTYGVATANAGEIVESIELFNKFKDIYSSY